MKTFSAVFGAAVLLTACSIGIQPDGNSPSVTYTVPYSYQTVFLRAQNQASECLSGKNQFAVHTEVDAAEQSGVVWVAGPLSAEVARTELKAIDARSTQVTQTVWGQKPWDVHALKAMHESVLLDTSVCVAYK